ncbi:MULTISPECIES: type IV toxin-antitoxin system AbiEi family antitoxin [unclassified Symbiopectobacterium]|uniref:type IV toxin-antitoxin system AbiEi family antitoxin n=1 Tax=unclassified Symbiopectobacterium TaxID=2794573 RepID=UPI0022277ABF|nr:MULTISPECIES: type IV toxin-antitoxin system AbiEi family antitoxin [unclassified Symbiopectobacterium]MCW2475028.1 type IV toxin-antitoxin system AbiEi family antitoxin domain-containing protein [Candidatus Symbiopectobacterium sp. NZEC151]MCW2482315.1 type IV toxin-antitoxin system AbiEi family antitoxin domain-containing protein [Candidatus Symbiopectobacterium sp. NZEC135]
MANYLNWLMQNTLPGQVLLQSWLSRNGIDRTLSYRYVQNGWLKRISQGVYCRVGREPDWVDAVSCLQMQWERPVRIAGLTSLALQGYSHYIEQGKPQIWLALPAYTKLPGWFSAFESSATFVRLYTSGLSVDVMSFTTELKIGDRLLTGSISELAAYEIASSVPAQISFEHADALFQGLNLLSPRKLQVLLCASSSVKTNRVMLYLAQRNGHPYFQYLDRSRIETGAGKRQIIPGGWLEPDYQITVPRAFKSKGVEDEST